MIPRVLQRLALTIGVIATGAGGCSNVQVSSAIVKPGKYSIYNCDQIATAGRAEAARERELKGLIDKAAQGPGGQVAIALAYRNEYLMAQGNLRELEAAAIDKNCRMPWRTESERAVR